MTFSKLILSDEDNKQLANYLSVTSSKDFNLRYSSEQPHSSGLYDYFVFGKLGSCMCGRMTTSGFCDSCHIQVFSHKQHLREKLGYYQLNFPVVYPTKAKLLLNTLNQLEIPVGESKNSFSTIKQLCYSYFKTEEETISLLESNAADIEETFDITKLGILGVLTTFRQKHPVLTSLINSTILISNPVDRPFRIYQIKGGKKTAEFTEETKNYKLLIEIDSLIRNQLTNKDDLSPYEQASLLYVLNNSVGKVLNQGKLIAPSKSSLVRNLLSSRIKRSGRTTITGDPTLPIDTVSIPKHLMYEVLRSDIVEEIERENLGSNGEVEFNEYSSLAESAFKKLGTNLVVLINRNPTLHKYNIMAYKVILNSDSVMKIPLLATEPYNADFDGDQMSFYPITDSRYKTLVFDRMGANNNWKYEKNNKYIYSPRHEILFGLYLGTTIVKDDRFKEYDTELEVEKDILSNVLYENSEIRLGGEITCFGRYLVSHTLNVNLDTLIGPVGISRDNISLILDYIYSTPEREKLLSSIQNLGIRFSTYLGNNTVDLNILHELYEGLILTELNKIIPEKGKSFDQIFSNIIQTYIYKDRNTGLEELFKSNNRLKISSLVDILQSEVYFNDVGGFAVRENTSLLLGKNSSSYFEHSIENREILSVKKTAVPVSGYITRQLSNLSNHIKYSSQRILETDLGYSSVWVEREWVKTSRTILDVLGTKIKIVSPVFNGSPIVHSNEIDTDSFRLSDGMYIGVSFMSSLTEELTQSALSLKHGGKLETAQIHKVHSVSGGIITEISDTQLTINDKYTYLLPKTILEVKVSLSDSIIKGQILYTFSETFHVDSRLEMIKSIIGLDSSTFRGKSVLDVIYAPRDGILTYCNGDIMINDEIVSKVNPKLAYYFPSNYLISKFDRISTGVLDLPLSSELFSKYDMFYIFCKQFYEIYSKDINLELLEVLFKCIYNNGYSVRTGRKNKMELLNILSEKSTDSTIFKHLVSERDMSTYDDNENLVLDFLLGKDE